LQFVGEGFEVTLEGKFRGYKSKVSGGEDETYLIALACSQKPDGGMYRALRQLADVWKTLTYTDAKTVS
jgi:hypothetical protein